MVSPYSFSIGDTTDMEPYLHGGIAVQVKTPKTFHFVSVLLHDDSDQHLHPFTILVSSEVCRLDQF